MCAKLLARLSDRRRVHDRHELVDVVDQQPVEQPLVSILQRPQSDVSFDVVALTANAREDACLLVFHRADVCRQQSTQTKSPTLLEGKGRRFVGGRMEQQFDSVIARVFLTLRCTPGTR